MMANFRFLSILRSISRKEVCGVVQGSFCRSCLQSQKSRWMSTPSLRNQKQRFQNGSYIILAIPIATFCLGTWQVQRRRWKLDLIEELHNMTLATPIDLPNDLEDVSSLEYRKVRVRGKFDHSQELYVLPRAPVESDEGGHGGSLMKAGPSKTGAHVITAFKLADRDLRIMVNRGWVPRNKINPATRSKGQITEEIDLVGVIRKSEKRPQFGAKNDPSHNQWHYKDQGAMASTLDTAPLLIDAVQNSTVPDGPVGGQTRVNLRNEHLSYIVTWYSLSVITFAGWYLRYWKGRVV